MMQVRSTLELTGCLGYNGVKDTGNDIRSSRRFNVILSPVSPSTRCDNALLSH